MFGNAFHVWAAKLAGVPNRISHSHNSGMDRANRIIASVYPYFSRLLIAKYSTQLISCGKEASQFLFPNQKDVFLLSNSIDTDYFAAIGESHRNYINTEFYIDKEVLKIVQVGRLDKVKNHKFSLEIAKKMKQKGIAFKMLFIRQGALFTELQNQITEFELTKQVIMLGLRKDIPQLMAGADVMLMPSLYEGFPVVLVEAQAVGLPAIISSNIPSEVDLNMNLISIKSLHEDINSWIDVLSKQNRNNRFDAISRLRILEENGFDVKKNAGKLSDLYHKMM